MTEQKTKNKSALSEKQLKQILGLNFLGLIIALFFAVTCSVDELEHLRAGWFVSQGDIPYRDFWEHHNPLLWFLFAPLIKILPENIYIALYSVRIIGFIVSCGSTFIIYKMTERFFGGKKAALFCLCLYFFYYPAWYMFAIFKPDTYMRFFYLLGLYNFFIYLDEKKLKNIMISSIAFTLSFLFLQTVLSVIVPLFIPLAVFLYKNRSEIKNILFACVPSLLIMAGFIYYLYATDSLTQYIQTNWIFNNIFLQFIEEEDRKNTTIIAKYAIFIISGYISYGYGFHKKQNTIFTHTIALLMTADLLKNLYFPNILPHYLILIFLFAGILTAQNLKFAPDYILKYLKYTCYVVFSLNMLIVVILWQKINPLENLSAIKKEETYFLNNGDLLNVFSPRLSYYWLCNDFEGIDNALFSRFSDYNVNTFIKQNNIKYISGKQIYWLQIAKKLQLPASFNMEILQNHFVDDEIFEHYQQTAPQIWKLKTPFSKEERQQNP